MSTLSGSFMVKMLPRVSWTLALGQTSLELQSLPAVKLDREFGIIQYMDLQNVDIMWIEDMSQEKLQVRVYYGSWVSLGLYSELEPVRRLLDFFTLINEMVPSAFSGIRSEAFLQREFDYESD